MGTLTESVEEYITDTKKIIGDVNVDHIQNSVDKYLNFTEEELDSLSKEECIYGQYLIMQYSVSLSRKINNLKSKLISMKRTFDRSFSGYYDNYKVFGADLIKASACAEHVHLRSMDNEICKVESLIQEYDGIVSKLEKISQIFKDLSFCKNKQ